MCHYHHHHFTGLCELFQSMKEAADCVKKKHQMSAFLVAHTHTHTPFISSFFVSHPRITTTNFSHHPSYHPRYPSVSLHIHLIFSHQIPFHYIQSYTDDEMTSRQHTKNNTFPTLVPEYHTTDPCTTQHITKLYVIRV